MFLIVAVTAVPGGVIVDAIGWITSYIIFLVAVTELPPISPVAEAASEFCAVTVYESIVILPIAVYVPLMFDEAIPLYVPEGTPAIVTLLAVVCIPWFLWWIVITADEAVVVIGFAPSVRTGTSSLTR